jgi:hypothetical protein
VNGTLAIDLGGVHNTSGGSVALDASDGTGQVVYTLPYSSPGTPSKVDFKLSKGSVYEVVLFQAERWGGGSNYMLTLANFIGGKTECEPACGDGVTVADEECDCGNDPNNLPAGCPGPNGDIYGGCSKQCKWGAFCGDGKVQAPEECDEGKSNGSETSKCSIACQAPRTCGDGKADTDLGEECDLGPNNGLKLDANREPIADQSDPNGRIFCTNDCLIPPQIYY